ncbi:DUF3768 domain-containing protein [Bradyrhizobium sp. CCGUVB14]|uniref:DUF3768 domain-containing protein n=1 Tax=Bradyrhizobium sp. CCGUVB14 TaxID=2949628 RepID=UPI0020B27FAF|nr:DUF3768 domain-containing protein [Bradyrhizobium sp. CCGUVB14]MCP3446196.1 DUF3768 domain-containing protein [Bradyrhizobium sp. CCGUVB14]
MSHDSTGRIRALNDKLRQDLSTGTAVMTNGIAAMGPEAVHRLVQTLSVFDDFCAANDPYSERDFGAFEFEGVLVAFKIDYYDLDLCFHSPDPADASVTKRVITLMRLDEY